jgi:hypothetical protein
MFTLGDQVFYPTYDKGRWRFHNRGVKPLSSYLRGRIPPLPSGSDHSFTDAQVQTFDPKTGESITGTELRLRESQRNRLRSMDRYPNKRLYSEMDRLTYDPFMRSLARMRGYGPGTIPWHFSRNVKSRYQPRKKRFLYRGRRRRRRYTRHSRY